MEAAGSETEGNNKQCRKLLLDKLLETPRSGSPAVLQAVCRVHVVPREVTDQRDYEKAKRGGIADVGSSNTSIAKPRSPSLHTLPGDVCVDTRISQTWAATSAHTVCAIFSVCMLHDG